MFRIRCAAFAVLALAWGNVPARAQIDYRNLDDERPVLTEDAYPVDLYAIEVLTPFTFEAAGSQSVYLFAPEVESGVLPNVQVGSKLPVAALADGATDWGLAGLKLYGLYNLNTESPSLPALALRADLDVPLGSLAGDNVRGTLKAIATRSWGRTRVHLNLLGTVGGSSGIAVDALPRWAATGAVDYTLFRQSVLLLAQLAALQSVQDDPTTVTAALGFRWQWRPTVVLDAGISRRLTAAGPDIALTIGLSQSLGFKALMPRGPTAAGTKGGSHADHH